MARLLFLMQTLKFMCPTIHKTIITYVYTWQTFKKTSLWTVFFARIVKILGKRPKRALKIWKIINTYLTLHRQKGNSQKGWQPLWPSGRFEPQPYEPSLFGVDGFVLYEGEQKGNHSTKKEVRADFPLLLYLKWRALGGKYLFFFINPCIIAIP